MRRPGTSLVVAASAAAAALTGPAAASAAPITVASVTPTTVAAPGTATVVFRVAGGDADATSSIVVRGTEFDRSTVSDEVESLTILTAGLSGKGSLAVALPPLSGFPPSCERGGVHPSSSVNAYKLTIPAHAVSALVVKVKVPVGFAGQTPQLEVSSSPLRAVGAAASGVDEKDDVVRAAIPRTGPTLDGLSMTVSAATDVNTYVAKGRVSPPRGGAMVRIIGTPSSSAPDRPMANSEAVGALGVFSDAMAPIGPTLAAYGKALTNATGRYAVRFTAPRGTVIVARSRGTAGVTLAGASCPVQLGD